jgi:hypothetical protein
MERRDFLALALAPLLPRARAPRILLRSSWQTVNIGDIAHTPGMLRWIADRFPDAEVDLWPGSLTAEVEALLKGRFPGLGIARSREEREAALGRADVVLHGSGPGLVGADALRAARAAGKPYGIGGITLSDAELRDHRELLTGARFVYCRDSDSLAALRAARIEGPAQDFGPDATFGLDLRDDAKADAFLKEQRLEPGRFACFVPRLRWTPYWKEGRKFAPEEIARREAENGRHRETDHAKIRDAIAAWVRDGGRRALLCPEMTYAVELLKPLLFDPLPEDVKPHVAIRPSYWLTAEAASTYARAAAVVSLELHSPIIAVANGTPALHVRQPTDTRKGRMWSDVGLGDWLFDVEASSGAQIASRLLEIAKDPDAARAAAARARAFAAERGARMLQALA